MPKRVDANQSELVALFRRLGLSVLILSEVGKGCPDIMVGYNKRNMLVEIKDGSKPPSGRKLTEAEQKFHDEWKGQVCIIKDVDEAVELVHRLCLDELNGG